MSSEPKTKIISIITNSINKGDLNTGDYMNLVAVIVQEVDQLNELSGEEKKQLTVNILTDLVQRTDLFGSEIQEILTEPTINNLVEVIINLAKGKYKIKERFRKIKSLWNKFKNFICN